MIGRWWFLTKDVKRRTCNRAICDRFKQRGLVDQTTTRTVDDARARFHFSDYIPVDQSLSIGRKWGMHCKKISSCIDIVEGGQLDLEIACLFLRNKWIIGNDNHAHRSSA